MKRENYNPDNLLGCMNFDMPLSEHFTLREMVRSGTAIERGIDNTPTPEVVYNLTCLCQNVLEPVRRQFGMTRITSGYRCKELNDAVGGVKNSQHITGEAADIHVSSIETARKIYDFIRDNLPFDQLLLERVMSNGCCWLHVSFTIHRNNRRQAMEINL